jgi:PAS domain S-box-containing protein
MPAAETVLIIDPDGPARRGTTRVLAAAGYTVVQRPDGMSALASIALDRPDVVLIAAVLPDVSSDAVIDEIRRDRSMDDVAVLLLVNAATSQSKLVDALDAGADGFITRPQRRETLLAVVGARVRQRKAVVALRTSETRFRALLTGLPDGAVVVDRGGIVRFANPSAIRLLGRSADELVGTVFAVPLSGPGEFEVELQRPDRTVVPVEIRVSTTEWDSHDAWLATLHDLTIRRDERARVSQSAALMRIAGGAARIGGWSLSLAEQQLQWSDEIRLIHDVDPGFTPTLDETLGFYSAEHREMVVREIDACVTTGKPFDFESQIVTAKGRRVWVRAIGEAVRDEYGRIIKLQGAFQDISEQKTSVERLAESSVRLETTLESITDAFVAYDKDWTFVHCNSEAERLMRLSREELVGRLLWDVFPALVGSAAEAHYRRAMAELVPVTFEEYFAPYDLWVEVRAYPSTEGLGVYFHDIGEQRRAQEQLRLLESSVSRLNDVILITEAAPFDVPGPRIVFVNEAFERITGFTKDEALGANPRILQGPGTDRATLAKIREALSRQTSIRTELFNYTKDGRGYWIELDLSPVIGPDGVASHFVAVERDITERKHAEERLQRSEALLRTAGHAARLGGWSLALPARTLHWSDETCVIHEMPPGSTPTLEEGLALFPPEVRAEITAHVDACAANGTPYDFEGPKFTATGRRIWVRTVGEAVRDATGTIVGIEGAFQDITARKEAEAMLRISEERLNHLSRATNDAIWDWDVRHDAMWWNEVFESLLGYARSAETTFDQWLGHVHADDRERVRQRMRQLLDSNTASWTDEYRFVADDGRIVAVFDRGYVIRDDDGIPMRVVGSMTDMTEHKRGEEALLQSRRALEILSLGNEALVRSESEADLLRDICQIAIGIGGFRLAWVGYAMDDAAKSVVPQAFAGMDSSDYFREAGISWSDTLPGGQGPAGLAIRTGEVVVITDVESDPRFARWRDAARVHGFRGVIALPMSDDNRTFGVLVLYLTEVRTPPTEELDRLRDLTDNIAFGIGNLRARVERRAAADQLARQAALLDKAQDAIFVLDLEHRVTYWNRSAERIYGWTAEEMMGESALERMAMIDPTTLVASVAATIANGDWTGNLRHVRRNSSEVEIEGRWSLLRDDDGRPTAILAINTDITERRKLEAQFFRAQRLESIGTLASGIAHDLNNLLAPIVMGVDLIRQIDSSEKLKRVLENIERSATRGAELVKQVLSFARGADGARVPLHLSDTVREIASIVHDTFPKNIVLRTDLAPDEWQVSGDPTQLNQVVLNLCVNARDAMPDGGRLIVRTYNEVIDEHYASMNRDVAPGRFVVTEVSDTGHGMPKEILDRIFEPFFTTKDVRTGTGLGLSTVIGIVRSYGGFVHVYSEVGNGTTFKIALPAQDSGAETAAAQEQRDPPPRGHGELILIVDDETSILSVTSQTLEAFGYRAITAEDGAEGIALYAQRRDEIAVVLTDMMMPVMDGMALISAVKRINPAAKIIAASGQIANAKIARAASAGVTDFLAKPYTADALLRRIHSALNAPSGGVTDSP